MKKQYILFGITPLLVVFLFSIVSATTALNSPVAGGNYSTTLNFTCTTNIVNALNASLLYNASGGPATTYLVTIVNTSASQTLFTNPSVSITSLAAANTYNMTCLVSNSTTTEQSPAKAGITIDNTNPTVTVARNVYEISPTETVVLTCTSSDNLDTSLTIIRTITKPDGNTISVASNSYEARGTDTDLEGLYSYICQAVDDPGNSASDTINFIVSSDIENPKVVGKGTTTINNTKKTNLSLILLITGIALVIIIVALVIIISITAEKKRRR